MRTDRTGRGLAVVLTALLLSGVASILNQVVWQRALKLYLGGSESISSMIVVLVFMLGLGIGSALAGVRARRSGNPLRIFGFVEVALFAVNAGIAALLSLDLAESIYSAQRLALSANVPLRVVYAWGALVMLLPPTILMGATLPLAAEACQRQLGATEAKLITILLALNTVGACIGAMGSSFYLLPYWGQRVSLGTAALFNLVAGVLVLATSLISPARSAPDDPERRTTDVAAVTMSTTSRGPFSLEESVGFVLGFLSLGYEMYLLRLVSLAHEPRPYTFAFTLLFFLLFWTLGVWLAGRSPVRPLRVLAAGTFLVASMPVVYAIDRWQVHFAIYRGGLLYFLPCVCFGAMYGTLVSRAAREWGRDVGRFYALNTLGSCLGILFFSLVGYEIRHDFNAVLIALGLVCVLIELRISDSKRAGLARPVKGLRRSQLAIAVAGLALLAFGLTTRYSLTEDTRTYWGRDGVIELRGNGSIWIDGLWHSRLSDGKNHFGSPYNWMMAVAAVLAHRDEPITDALVVGNGIGITAVTLAKLEGLTVDAYEINRTLGEILRAYPRRTLYAATHPRVRIRWQDGRSGLALDPKQYDLIVSAPLHLRAAGSSNLLSREYLALARSRLKKNGVMVLYSFEGRPEQAAIIGATVRTVFSHSETFLRGILTVASDEPIHLTAAEVQKRLQRKDPLYREMAEYDRFLRHRMQTSLFEQFDSERLSVPASDYLVTDDHPLVEYAEVVVRLLAARTQTRAGAP